MAEKEGEAECPINLIKRCPAIILAVSRTDNVNGRIIFLTSSIRTIKGMSTGGVPKGTKWVKVASISIEFFRRIWPNHRGKAIEQAKVK